MKTKFLIETVVLLAIMLGADYVILSLLEVNIDSNSGIVAMLVLQTVTAVVYLAVMNKQDKKRTFKK